MKNHLISQIKKLLIFVKWEENLVWSIFRVKEIYFWQSLQIYSIRGSAKGDVLNKEIL